MAQIERAKRRLRDYVSELEPGREYSVSDLEIVWQVPNGTARNRAMIAEAQGLLERKVLARGPSSYHYRYEWARPTKGDRE